MGSVTHLPDYAVDNPAPAPLEEELSVDVPERPGFQAARRPWFSDRWRAFRFETADASGVLVRLHHQLRRRRR